MRSIPRAQCLASAFLCAMLSLTFLSGEGAGTSDDLELNIEMAVGVSDLTTNFYKFYFSMDWSWETGNIHLKTAASSPLTSSGISSCV
jgi:hypothetical protein